MKEKDNSVWFRGEEKEGEDGSKNKNKIVPIIFYLD